MWLLHELPVHKIKIVAMMLRRCLLKNWWWRPHVRAACRGRCNESSRRRWPVVELWRADSNLTTAFFSSLTRTLDRSRPLDALTRVGGRESQTTDSQT